MSMMISNKKNIFFAFGITAALIVLSACNNDTDTKSVSAKPDSANTTADTVSAKPVAKVKKGKASVMMSSENKTKIEKGSDGIYTTAEVMPQYPGGDAAISKFVSDNINYPQSDLDNNKEGTVKVSFVVDEKGNVTNPMVSGTGVSSSINSEAERIVKQMPAWKPGMVKGKPVKTRLELPITFKIDADS
jgi:periplasmic protein TonB